MVQFPLAGQPEGLPDGEPLLTLNEGVPPICGTGDSTGQKFFGFFVMGAANGVPFWQVGPCLKIGEKCTQGLLMHLPCGMVAATLQKGFFVHGASDFELGELVETWVVGIFLLPLVLVGGFAWLGQLALFTRGLGLGSALRGVGATGRPLINIRATFIRSVPGANSATKPPCAPHVRRPFLEKCSASLPRDMGDLEDRRPIVEENAPGAIADLNANRVAKTCS